MQYKIHHVLCGIPQIYNIFVSLFSIYYVICKIKDV
jgi:hypothetical protein